jgi:hypothetical protein
VVVEPFSSDTEIVKQSIRGASLVLMPSLEEGFGLTGLEAISEGVPVLLSRTSGLAQAIERHVPHLARMHIIDAQDGAEPLARRIKEMLEDRAAAFRNTRALRDAMRLCFDWDRAASDLIRVLMEGPGNAAPRAPSAGAAPTPANVSVAVASMLKDASAPLLGWRQTLRTTETWLERPELARVVSHATGTKSKPLVLLGTPGSGKSALLARAAHQLVANDVAVLAIKADRLPNDIDTPSKLASELGLTTEIHRVLEASAALRTTVLILDQLDALADLVDLKTERLSVLLDLVDRLAKVDGVRIVLSCREIDFAHDVRFQRLEADELRLVPLTEEAVARMLGMAGIDPLMLAHRVRDLLRIPQSLDVFLEVRRHEPDISVFETYQRMLDALWRHRLARRDDRTDLDAKAGEIALEMAAREELWLARSLLTRRGLDRQVDALLGLGFLIESDGKVAFSHQTFFEFARARAFLAGSESLATYTKARQGSLFVRPTLWTSLAYLRAMDLATYFVEIEALWRDETLRLHVKALLVEFIGQVENPHERELALFLPLFEDDKRLPGAIEAVAGRPAWFRVLQARQIPGVMRGTHAGMAVHLLRNAIGFAPEDVTSLLEAHWKHDPAKHSLIASTLIYSTHWNARMGELAAEMVQEGTITQQNGTDALVHTALSALPGAAPRIIAAHLTRQFDLIPTQAHEPTIEVTSELDAFFADEALRPYDKLLETAQGLHFLINTAEVIPRGFLESVWPWFVRVVNRIVRSDPVMHSYRPDYSSWTSVGRSGLVNQVADALDTSLRTVASEDASYVAAFVDRWKTEDALAVHRFLVVVLENALPAASTIALDYLLGDSRRLVVGDDDACDNYTSRLIRSLAPLLRPEQLAPLEAAIHASCSRIEARSGASVDSRRHARDENRRHRLRLLHAVGLSRISERGRAQAEQEARRFPNAAESLPRIMAGSIGSPVTTEQMLRMKDDDLLKLFEELPDSTVSRHPSRRFAGDSEQLSEAFAEASKRSPDRFLSLLPRFEPGVSELPVTFAIRSLAQVLPLPHIEATVLDLVALGFFAKDFRGEIAHALNRAARGNAEMSAPVMATLTSWLGDGTPAEGPSPSSDAPARTDPLLFGWRGGRVLPGGNFPLLLALTTGHLARSAPDIDGWITLLERHLDRTEDARVWETLAIYLGHVLALPPTRAERFLDDLFAKFPSVRDSRDGIAIIAHAMHRLPATTIERWITALERGRWPRREQAVGELLVLAATRGDAPAWSRDRLERELCELEGGASQAHKLVLGIAHASARLWDVPERRETTTEILARLIPHVSGVAAEAVMAAFGAANDPPWDKATQRVLSKLLDAPGVLVAQRSTSFVEYLRDVLPAGAELVAKLGLAFVTQAESADSAGQLGTQGPVLVDIAMTLQRLGSPTREKGLDLFESLLRLNAYGARDVLAEIDPTSRSGLPARRAARTPRKARRRKQ